MVKQSDRAPLLDWEEIPPPDPNQAAPPPPAPPREDDAPPEKSSQPVGRRSPPGTAAVTGWSSGTTTTAITCSPTKSLTAVIASGDGSPGRPRTVLCGHGWDRPHALGTDRHVPFPGLSVRDQWEEKDQIVAVFVVTFDTRSGKRANCRRGIRLVVRSWIKLLLTRQSEGLLSWSDSVSDVLQCIILSHGSEGGNAALKQRHYRGGVVKHIKIHDQTSGASLPRETDFLVWFPSLQTHCVQELSECSPSWNKRKTVLLDWIHNVMIICITVDKNRQEIKSTVQRNKSNMLVLKGALCSFGEYILIRREGIIVDWCFYYTPKQTEWTNQP